jgi:hypothetical protein
MKPTRLAGAVALASVALLAGCGVTHHTATPAPHTPPAHNVPLHALAADPALDLLNELHISLPG